MAIVTFSKPVAFPTAPLRDLLSKHLPLYRWQCGEADMGGAREMGVFRDHDLLTGRSASTVIFTELRAMPGRFDAPAPEHEWHLLIGQPTTELIPIADRIIVIACLAVMVLDEHHARCQLRPGGNWLTGDDLVRVLKLVIGGEDLSVADGLGVPPGMMSSAVSAPGAAIAPRAEATAPSLTDGHDMARRMLPPLILMLDRPLVPDWKQIETFANALDAEGGWRHARVGDADLLVGRGTRVAVWEKPEPVPLYVYEDAYSRSFWYRGDKAAVAAHRRQLSVGTALDTSAADWVTIRQVAKVVTLVTGLLARLPGTLAVHNLNTGTIFEPQMVGGFLSILGNDQLPVQLWTFAAWHSLEDGNVSVSTSGLEPFLGHELETWNAPLTCEEVQNQVSDLIIYLLQQGPVIGDGDTAGRTSGDQAIRCFRGPSRAERAQPVQALCLEFGEKRVETPRPDPLRSEPAPRSSVEDSGRAAAAAIDEAVLRMLPDASPAMRKILGGTGEGRASAPAPAPAPSAPQPAPGAAPVMARRLGGFGRKGL